MNMKKATFALAAALALASTSVLPPRPRQLSQSVPILSLEK